MLLSYSSQLLVIDKDVDEQGRTLLMNYVSKQEEELKEIVKEYEETIKTNSDLDKINKLWHKLENDEEITEVRKMYIDTNLKLRKLESTYNTIITTTLITIAKMVKANNKKELKEELDVKDNAGNTVLNYCKTKPIYEKLRELGAPFQLDMASYFTDTSYMNFSTIWGSILLVDSIRFLLLENKDNFWKNIAYLCLVSSGLKNLDRGLNQAINKNKYKIPYKA
jgi:hypothetical protein